MYADQRMYNPLMGKFFSPDETKVATASFQNPISWNMYAYALGDPVNGNDPTGRLATALDCISDPDSPACNSPCQPQPALQAGGGLINTDPDSSPTDAADPVVPDAAPEPAPPAPSCGGNSDWQKFVTNNTWIMHTDHGAGGDVSLLTGWLPSSSVIV